MHFGLHAPPEGQVSHLWPSGTFDSFSCLFLFILEILVASCSKGTIFFNFVKQDVHAGVPTLFSLRPGQLRLESLDLIQSLDCNVNLSSFLILVAMIGQER